MYSFTKTEIINTFISLTRIKNIDKITVKDLVSACNISRQTFYYHFQDILDVMECAIKQCLEQTVQKSLREENAKKAIYVFVSSFYEEKGLILRLMNSQKYKYAQTILINALEDVFEKLFIKKYPNKKMSKNEKDINITFYTYGICGVLFKNLNNKDIDIDELSKCIYLIVKEDFDE